MGKEEPDRTLHNIPIAAAENSQNSISDSGNSSFQIFQTSRNLGDIPTEGYFLGPLTCQPKDKGIDPCCKIDEPQCSSGCRVYAQDLGPLGLSSKTSSFGFASHLGPSTIIQRTCKVQHPLLACCSRTCTSFRASADIVLIPFELPWIYAFKQLKAPNMSLSGCEALELVSKQQGWENLVHSFIGDLSGFSA